METETQRLIDDLAIARDTRDRAQAEATRQTLRARELDRQLSGLLSEHLSVTLIAEERRRQVEQEGWTPEHDDTLAGGELALAAACYAVNDQPRIAADVFRCWPMAARVVQAERTGSKSRVAARCRRLIASTLLAREVSRRREI